MNHVSSNIQQHNINLRPFANHIHYIVGLFLQIEFSRIFREWNQIVDKLSKEGTMLPTNNTILLEFDDQ